MNVDYHYQHALTLLRERYQRKCEEVKRLIISQKYAPTVVEIRQQEADELKEILDELTKLNSSGILKLQFYDKLHEYLTAYTKSHPDLLGHNIIFGPDKPELFGYYSRIRWNIPISFFKK